jgi:DNA-binding beta-propeller fold protein YncE
MTPVATPDPIPQPTQPTAQPTQPVVKSVVPAPSLPPQKILMRRVAMIDIPGRPGFDGVAMSNGNLVMTHPAASTVDVFNLTKRRVVAQVKDMKGANGIVVDDKAGKAYIANSDANEIAVVSTKDWTIEKRIALKASPSALLLIPELDLLLASNWRDLSVSEIDLANNGVANTAVLDARPGYMAYDPNNKQIFVSLEDQNAIAVLDPSLKQVKRINLAASQPTGLALDVTSRRLFVSVRYAVLALDADSGQELNRVAAPAGVDALWFEPAQGKVYAASGGAVLVLNTKGRLEVDREWATDVKGHTVAFDSQKNMLYLPGGRDGRSKLLILRSMDKDAQDAAARGLSTADTVAKK